MSKEKEQFYVFPAMVQVQKRINKLKAAQHSLGLLMADEKTHLLNLVRIYCRDYGFILARGAEHPKGTDRITIGGWRCPHSPVEFCCFNSTRDSQLKHCLFCGKPEERF